MNKIALSNDETNVLLHEHRCPKCNSFDTIFYNPNLLDNRQVQTEFECNDCSLYLILTLKLDSISTYGSMMESVEV